MAEWAESCVSEVGCRELVDLGYMPEKPLIGWRSAFGEAVPKPRAGETVVFADFFERGFSVPTSPFFRRLLRHYGLQLHHLNPNGILHISIFVTLCEAYLGIEPHFGLWKWLYCVRPVSKLDPNNAACAGAVGGASIQLRPKAQYISIPLRTTKGWQARWFYSRNEKPSLPDFVAGHCPVKLPSWSNPPTADEMAEVDKILPHLNGLFQNGLDGALLIATFLSRRIQPIKKRCHRMSEFTGCSDPTRERLTKLTLDEILSRVDQLLSTDTNICTDGKPLPCHHKRPPKNDLSKYLSTPLDEDEEGVDMRQATDAVTIASYPPLVKPRTDGAGSYGVLVQQKAKEVVARSCSELAQQRESCNSAPIAQPPPHDEDTETMFHRMKRKSDELLASSTDLGLQNLLSLSTVAICKRKKKLLSKDVMLPCLLLDSSASPAKEVSASASSQAADLTVPHREEMPEDELVPLSPPHVASPSPTHQSEPCPLQSPPARHTSPTTTLSTLNVPESIEMMHVPCRPLPCDNLGSTQRLVGFATDSVEVEGEVKRKKAGEEPGTLSVQMKDMENNLLWEIDDEMEHVEVDWEKVKEAATSFETRLAEITRKYKRASELIVKLKQENKELEVKLKQENKDLEIKLKQENKELEVKLKQENKDLEVKLKQENKVARAFEKKAWDLYKELEIMRADHDSLSRRFQDAKKKAADLCDAFNAPCGKFSVDNPAPDGVEVVAERLGNFPTELTDAAAADDGGHCRIGMQLALSTRG